MPGNIPTSEHITRLLASGGDFVACYRDLSNFKPFNDQYGYWRGDEAIKLAASTAVKACGPQRDFVGHVGGDDFLLLFQSSDWKQRCDAIVAEFNAKVVALYDDRAPIPPRYRRTSACRSARHRKRSLAPRRWLAGSPPGIDQQSRRARCVSF